MSNVFFISDLHLGHDNVIKWSRDWRKGDTIEEHDQWLVDSWNSVVGKRDCVFVLGDVAWREKDWATLKKMRGQKILVRGNHDKPNVRHLTDYFQDVWGSAFYKGYWLTHIPIHPSELRKRKNIHGHVHAGAEAVLQNDPNYISVCVESCGGVPVDFERIVSGDYTGALPVHVTT